MAAVRATRRALPVMLAAGHGVIITICSANAHLPDPTAMDYSAAKAALANFCKALSKEAGPQGIRANTVSPGPVSTDLWLGQGGVAATVSAATGAKPDDVASQAAHQMVTGRFTKPGEVADLVVFVASDLAANVTGADFAIDGGLIPTWQAELPWAGIMQFDPNRMSGLPCAGRPVTCPSGLPVVARLNS